MAKKDCEDCKGTGEILTESIGISRPYFENAKLVVEVIEKGDWQNTICPCVGEDDAD